MVAQKVEKVVIDTNVVVSALLFGGVPAELIQLWKNGVIRPFASRDIIDEYVRVLAYPKFKLHENEIQYLLYTEILPHFDVVALKPAPEPIVTADPVDDMSILCAEAAGAKVIISGDRHLIALESYRNIRILSPSQFLHS